ncbi:Putative zinc-or iron-chelating domain-containing protein [Poseidonocella pacifica]|uniref:Putative zinc-or iron-chelating domain-containing protein n=1 Tax=Poseidonocella pacifica TaxID=871651 RepID=A0A1I0V9Z7_9RHOB|nr:YkgJ family cysteine cluster protein [Poseidonocella pacifica]SFA72877.1 Putative zinc-or iron-chelating domain-containing protein [Poseidonocella pacifica]
MPQPPRARRRRATKENPRDTAALVGRVERASVSGIRPEIADRARRMLIAWLRHAASVGMPFSQVVRRLASGEAATQIAQIDLEDQAARLEGIACGAGCAFCCILNGADGGTILEHEAQRMHAALLPFAGSPDGRAAHPDACAALDPETMRCRVYEDRPMICRSYHSTSAEACMKNADGIPAAGTGVLGAQPLHLTLQALVRDALTGIARSHTYSLVQVGRGTSDGLSEGPVLDAARHPPRALRDELKRLAGR